jgi:ferritin-like metal-binding protein YciE
MIQNLIQLYYDQLRDILSAENQLLESLPEMAALASNERLRETITSHLEETRAQRERLEKIFTKHGIQGAGEDCQAMRGLIKEANLHVGKTEVGPLRDAVLIASANRVEHYEIAAYGVARAFAECLEFDEDVKLLSESIEEEGAADRKLTELATGSLFRDGINERAAD